MNDETLLPFERQGRTILERIKQAKSDPKFGGDPYKRTIAELLSFGVVNINKPAGPTSHQVSSYLKDILGQQKAGHSGTLDPNVTGVLPIAIAHATRVVQVLLSSGKEYICVLHLHDDYDPERIREVMKTFVGKIKQMPPIKSAIKRQWRFRKIYYIEVIEIDGRDVLFRIGCQAGTYIRKICHDVGVALGSGGHMSELKRTKAGGFTEKTMHTLQDLKDAMHYYQEEKNEAPLRKLLLPFEVCVDHLPKVWILDSAVDQICHGQNLAAPGVVRIESDIQLEESVAVMTLKNELVALGTARMLSKEATKKDKGIAIKIEKVFMPGGTYPKYSK